MNTVLNKCFLTLGLCIVALSVLSQKTDILITHPFDKTPLLEVLEWMEVQHKVKIAYSKEMLEGIIVDGDFKNTPVEQFLDNILNHTHLTYRMLQGDRILVGPTEELSLLMPIEEGPVLISGQVIGPDSQPLEYANLIHKESQTGTFTDEEGYFEWPQPLRTDSLWIEVSYLGFEKQMIRVKDASVPLRIQLRPSPQFFKEIEVVALLPFPKLQEVLFSNSITSKEFSSVSFLPGGSNIFSDIQQLPGIAAYNEQLSAQLKVRGGNSDENLIILNGMTLYNIDHFYGFFSAVHPGIFDDIQVYKSAFPIEYSGRTSSIVELNSSEKQDRGEAKNSLGLDLISASALTKLALTDHMSITAAGRLTHQDIANTPFFQLSSDTAPKGVNLPPEVEKRKEVINLSPGFSFNDFYAQWQWVPGEDISLSVSLFSGFDQYTYDYAQTYPVLASAGRVKITEKGRESVAWRNAAWGFQFHKKWNDGFRTDLNVNQSSYKIDREESFSIIQTFRNVEKVRAAPESNKNNDILGRKVDLKNQWQLSKESELTFGYSYLNEQIDFGIANSNGLDIRGINRSDQASTNSLYAQHSWRPNAQVEIVGGLNAKHYSKLDQLFWSPRIQMNLHLNSALSLKGSWSLYQQFLRQLYHEDVFGKNQTLWVLAGSTQILPNLEVPFIRSRHWMLGANWQADAWEFDIELFDKQRDGILEYALRRPGFNKDGVITEPVFGFFQGEGWTRGMDLLIKRNGRKYTGWISYTLSRSMHQLDGVNFNQPFPSPEDSRHQLSWMNQYNLNAHWMLSASYIFASGLPYLNYSKISEIPDSRRLFSYDLFLDRYPSYQRFDLSLNYRTSLFKLDTQLGLSVFNVFNRKNIKYRQFVFSVEEENSTRILGTELELLPRIWNLSVEVRF